MFFRTASSPALDGDATDVPQSKYTMDVMLILAADDRKIIGPGRQRNAGADERRDGDPTLVRRRPRGLTQAIRELISTGCLRGL
jgi:hypothetical protein